MQETRTEIRIISTENAEIARAKFEVSGRSIKFQILFWSPLWGSVHVERFFSLYKYLTTEYKAFSPSLKNMTSSENTLKGTSSGNTSLPPDW